MRGAILYAPGDVRVEQRDDPKIIEPTDVVIRLAAACVCGSDLWRYRGIEPVTQPTPMGPLISRIESHSIDPGKVFDLALPLDQAAEAYWAMDERRAVKVLLQP